MAKQLDVSEYEKKIAQLVTNIAAPKIFQDIENHYEEVIKNFYSDYKPKVYERTGNLYLASSGWYGMGNKNLKKFKNGFSVGITVSGGFIKENASDHYFSLYDGQADTELIFKNAFVGGRHGNKLPQFGYSPKTTKPSPKKEMDKWFTYYCKTEFHSIVDSAVAIALRQI